MVRMHIMSNMYERDEHAAHNRNDNSVHMYQEVGTSATFDDDMNNAQHSLRDHHIQHKRYSNMALATLLPHALVATNLSAW